MKEIDHLERQIEDGWESAQRCREIVARLRLRQVGPAKDACSFVLRGSEPERQWAERASNLASCIHEIDQAELLVNLAATETNYKEALALVRGALKNWPGLSEALDREIRYDGNYRELRITNIKSRMRGVLNELREKKLTDDSLRNCWAVVRMIEEIERLDRLADSAWMKGELERIARGKGINWPLDPEPSLVPTELRARALDLVAQLRSAAERPGTAPDDRSRGRQLAEELGAFEANAATADDAVQLERLIERGTLVLRSIGEAFDARQILETAIAAASRTAGGVLAPRLEPSRTRLLDACAAGRELATSGNAETWRRAAQSLDAQRTALDQEWRAWIFAENAKRDSLLKTVRSAHADRPDDSALSAALSALESCLPEQDPIGYEAARDVLYALLADRFKREEDLRRRDEALRESWRAVADDAHAASLADVRQLQRLDAFAKTADAAPLGDAEHEELSSIVASIARNRTELLAAATTQLRQARLDGRQLLDNPALPEGPVRNLLHRLIDSRPPSSLAESSALVQRLGESILAANAEVKSILELDATRRKLATRIKTALEDPWLEPGLEPEPGGELAAADRDSLRELRRHAAAAADLRAALQRALATCASADRRTLDELEPRVEQDLSNAPKLSRLAREAHHAALAAVPGTIERLLDESHGLLAVDRDAVATDLRRLAGAKPDDGARIREVMIGVARVAQRIVDLRHRDRADYERSIATAHELLAGWTVPAGFRIPRPSRALLQRLASARDALAAALGETVPDRAGLDAAIKEARAARSSIGRNWAIPIVVTAAVAVCALLAAWQFVPRQVTIVGLGILDVTVDGQNVSGDSIRLRPGDHQFKWKDGAAPGSGTKRVPHWPASAVVRLSEATHVSKTEELIRKDLLSKTP